MVILGYWDTINLLVKVTKEWDITYGGEKPKLTSAKAKEVYTEVFWLRNQIEEALSESLDFTKAWLTNCLSTQNMSSLSISPAKMAYPKENI